jgi:hypothetical protein
MRRALFSPYHAVVVRMNGEAQWSRDRVEHS